MPKILIKRGTTTQWNASTTALSAGEIGLDTTLNVLKIGNGTSLWQSLPSLNYTPSAFNEAAQDAVMLALSDGTHSNITVTYNDNSNSISLATGPDVVTTTSLNNTLTNPSSGYVAIADIGVADGVASLGPDGKIPDSEIPSGIARDSEIPASTSNLTEGTNLYFTDERAQDAIGNLVGVGLDYDDSTGSIYVDPSEFALNTIGEPKADVHLSGYKITALGTPTASTDAANKSYVDSVAAGLSVLDAARVYVGTNINLSNALEAGDVIDGITLVAGDRVLVNGQTAAAQNGVYVVQSSGAAIRATDFDSTAEVSVGDFIFVSSGTTYSNTGWVQTNIVSAVGTSPIAFTQFSGAGTYLAGPGLVLTGNTFSVSGLAKVDVGLGNVDNTSDANKPVSTATQTALNAKLDTSSFTYSTINIPVYNAIADLPSASSNHGRWAHVHGEGAMYFAHGGSWYKALSQQDLYETTNAQASSYTVQTSDLGKLIEMSGGGTLTITDSSSFPVGFSVDVLQTGSSQVTIAGDGFTPNATPGLKLRSQWSGATLLKRGSNSWVVMGDLAV